MFYEIILGTLVTLAGWSLLAADTYVIKAKTRAPNALSALQSTRPARAEQLELEEADRLRSEGFLVEKNIRFYLAGELESSDDDSRAALWPGEVMNLSQAHELPNSAGEGQTVCVVDTGIDKFHSMFASVQIEAYNSIDESSEVSDGNGHGTFVSSLILGQNHPSAPAPAANLIAVKGLGDDGSGTLLSVVRGIEYCQSKSSVLNLSLGTSTDSEILKQSIASALAAGTTVVAAAMNSGSGDVGFPAGYPGVITVTSVDKDLQIGGFSSHGKEVDYTAPGVRVWGALPNEGSATMSGNSMATGFVSGIVALQKSRGALSVVGRDLGLPPEYQGLGLVDAFATALNLAD